MFLLSKCKISLNSVEYILEMQFLHRCFEQEIINEPEGAGTRVGQGNQAIPMNC